jgi:hypothetical protein
MYAKKYYKYKQKYLNYKKLIGGSLSILSKKEKEVYEKGKKLFGTNPAIFRELFTIFTIDLCCIFNIIDDIIDLTLIDGCDNVKESIDKLEKLAKESNIHKIILEDGSHIIIPIDSKDYNFSLKFLYILCYGFSWYNSIGYKSTKYDNEVIHNLPIINLPLFEFIDNDDILDEFLGIFPKYNKDNIIKDIMIDIKTNKITSIEQIIIINKILSIAKEKLLYDIHLEKIIT